MLQITSERQELSDVPSTTVAERQLTECVQNLEVIGVQFIACRLLLN